VADSLTAEVSGCYFIADKGYDSNAHRAYLLSNNNILVIPGRKHRKEPILYDQGKYKLSMRIENFFARMKEDTRLTLRSCFFDQNDISQIPFWYV
jgi:transposase